MSQTATNFDTGAPNVQNAVIQYVESKLGQPYQFGGPPTGGPTDCSGLADEAYTAAGIALPRTSEEQWAWCQQHNFTTNTPQVGDLIFTEGNPPGHVGIYIGNNQVLQDPHTGAVVDIVALAQFGSITGIGEPWKASGQPALAASTSSSSGGSSSTGCVATAPIIGTCLATGSQLKALKGGLTLTAGGGLGGFGAIMLVRLARAAI